MKVANKRLHSDPKSGERIGVIVKVCHAAFLSGEPKR
jgi:hypothetical protein